MPLENQNKDNSVSMNTGSDVNFATINEEAKYFEESPKSKNRGFMYSFMSGQVPEMEGFELDNTEGEGYTLFPHTPVGPGSTIKTPENFINGQD